MNTTRASITTLLVGTGILFLGYGLLITLLPLRARIEDFSTTMIGVMGGAYFAGFALGCVIGPIAVKRVGHIRAFAGFAALATVLLLILPLAIDPGAWAKAHHHIAAIVKEKIDFIFGHGHPGQRIANRRRGRQLEQEPRPPVAIFANGVK